MTHVEVFLLSIIPLIAFGSFIIGFRCGDKTTETLRDEIRENINREIKYSQSLRDAHEKLDYWYTKYKKVIEDYTRS